MRRLVSLLFHDVYETQPEESGFAGTAAERYKLPLTDFEEQLRRLADVAAGPLWLASQPSTVGDPALALTVDDGGLSYHHLVAERLEARGWRGHCFVTTGWIGRRGFLHAHHLRELHAGGHVIGSHSVTHPARFAACTPEEMRREWRDSRRTLEDVLGAEVNAASVPGGYFSARVAEAASAAGFRVLFTSEPETRVREMVGCSVFGRFTLRRGSPHDQAARFASGEPAALYGAWAAWNAKKALKALLGPGYPQLAARLGRPARSGTAKSS